MASPIEIRKMKAELLGVSHAKANLEIRIEEMLEEIQRLKNHVEVQIKREVELQGKIAETESALKN
jgi:hypothetical protein